MRAGFPNFNKYCVLKYASVKIRKSDEKIFRISNIILTENTIYFSKYNRGFILDYNINIKDSKINTNPNTKNIIIQNNDILIEVKSESSIALYNLIIQIYSNK